MKTMKLTTLLIGLALIFGSTSCKYEEGPGISLRTKKARLAGDWFIEKIIDEDGTEVYTDDGSYSITFNKDGSGSGTEDGDETNFTWEFDNKKEKVKISISEDGETFSISYKILRLTNKEFWVEQTDGDYKVEIQYKAK